MNKTRHELNNIFSHVLKREEMASLSAPEAYATPDDQGNFGFCTRFALAKTVANGFMDKKFDPYQKLDFVQKDISSILVNCDQVKI